MQAGLRRALVVVSCAVTASGVIAATDDASLEEIVVTAQKRSERLLDVPASVSAVTGDRLQSLQVNSLSDLANYVPGLSVAAVAHRDSGRSSCGVSARVTPTPQPARWSVPMLMIYRSETPRRARAGRCMGSI